MATHCDGCGDCDNVAFFDENLAGLVADLAHIVLWNGLAGAEKLNGSEINKNLWLSGWNHLP